ncbi:MAG: glycosyl transferase family protein [Candidatus Saganbacteria bacterium]|uniref:Glycosyl transferase family protein n=1 Tax=Candidatus Saganbacteria bacterium TaxID=2575572 RepID=A0A833KZP2_UNCSA|nr:MAG: glycosyl transferase family protein [Candidatus Saganbacteria bacterium]
MSPKVSVCIPNFNRSNYLKEAIDSVLSQTFTDFELIIVDDLSTDNSAEVVRSYSDSRIKFYVNKRNLGLVGNWNECLSKASGEYVSILHNDDRYLNNYLEEASSTLDREKDIGYFFSNCNTIDENGKVLWKQKYVGKKHFFLFTHAWDKKSFIASGREFIKEHIYDCVTFYPTIMVRRGCYNKIGGFSDKFVFGIDWYMWMKIEMLGYKVAFSDKVLVDYRRHKNRQTDLLLEAYETSMDDFKVVESILKESAEYSIFSKKEETLAKRKQIRDLLLQYFQAFWLYIKKKEFSQVKRLWQKLEKFKKEKNIRYDLRDILWALFAVKL